MIIGNFDDITKIEDLKNDKQYALRDIRKLEIVANLFY